MRFEGDRLWRCSASTYQRLPDKEDDAKDVLDAGQINAHEGAKVSLQYHMASNNLYPNRSLLLELTRTDRSMNTGPTG